MQALIDNSLEALQGESIWRNYLELGIPQASLTFETAIGRSRIEAAASIVDPDSPAPLRSRQELELLTGKIPTIKEKFRMSQKDFRSLKVMEALPISDEQKKQTLIKKLYDDVKKASVAGDKRVDIMLLQAISTLQVDVNVTNNPDGVAFGVVDLLAKPYQKQGVPVIWSDSANAKPIDDIEGFLTYQWTKRGRKFGRIQMSFELWLAFKKTTQVRSMLQTYFNVGKANATFAVTLENVNEFLAANKWPRIEIVEHVTGIEKDGIITPYSAFDSNNVVFMPEGKIGILENSFAVEEWMKSESVTYANFERTIVSKWMDNDPVVEFTAMELNAFPAVDVDNIFILETDTVQANFV